MKNWHLLTKEERKKLEERFADYWLDGRYSVAEIATKLDISYALASWLLRKFYS